MTSKNMVAVVEVEAKVMTVEAVMVGWEIAKRNLDIEFS